MNKYTIQMLSSVGARGMAHTMADDAAEAVSMALQFSPAGSMACCVIVGHQGQVPDDLDWCDESFAGPDLRNYMRQNWIGTTNRWAVLDDQVELLQQAQAVLESDGELEVSIANAGIHRALELCEEEKETLAEAVEYRWQWLGEHDAGWLAAHQEFDEPRCEGKWSGHITEAMVARQLEKNIRLEPDRAGRHA